MTLWIPSLKGSLSAITPTCWSMICNSNPHKSGLITLLKLKEGNSASSKRPLSKENTSWTVDYFNYCHYHVFFLSFPFSFKRARKLSTTPWKAQDIPATIRIEWVATSPFPYLWEPTCESSCKSFTFATMVWTAGKWLEMT